MNTISIYPYDELDTDAQKIALRHFRNKAFGLVFRAEVGRLDEHEQDKVRAELNRMESGEISVTQLQTDLAPEMEKLALILAREGSFVVEMQRAKEPHDDNGKVVFVEAGSLQRVLLVNMIAL